MGEAKCLNRGLRKVRNITNRTGLPIRVQMEADIIYQAAQEKGICRGRNIRWVAGASVYLGARKCGRPIALSTMCNMADLEGKKVGRVIRLINRDFHVAPIPATPADMLPVIIEYLNSFEDLIHLAEEFLNDRIMIKHTFRKDQLPGAVAGAAIFLILRRLYQDPVTRQEVADAAGISISTLSKLVNPIWKSILRDFDKESELSRITIMGYGKEAAIRYRLVFPNLQHYGPDDEVPIQLKQMMNDFPTINLNWRAP